MRKVRISKRVVAVAAVVVVVGGAAVAAAGARSSSTTNYRTATVAKHAVDQVLDVVATIEPVSQASVAFPVAGTVEAVSVAVGDEVVTGQRLASLDLTSLTKELNSKQAALDQANLTLQLALAGEDVGSVGGGAPSGGVGRRASAGAGSELRDAQQAVLDAQRAVDASTIAARTALDAAAAVCVVPEGDASTTSDPSEVTASDAQACLAALQAVLVAQEQVSADQEALTAAAADLTALLEDLAANPPTTTSTTTPQGGGNGGPAGGGSAGSPSGPTGGSGSVPTGGSGASSSGVGGSSPSAEDLIAYQKKVDAAELAVVVADQAIAQASIVSPISGTVASVGFAAGDDVTAASATQAIVVVGQGGFEVSASISVTDLPDVEVGQSAIVTPDGGRDPIRGEVVRIGVAGDGSGSTTTYPVTIGLTGDTSSLGNGSTASVAITTAASASAVAVPTSAVTVDGTRSTVKRLVDGKATTTTVEVGAVGRTWTEITSGLSVGDEIVLADLDAPLPGSATDGSSASGGTGGEGGTFTFPGGGSGPPAGFPGGGARPGG